MECTGSSELRNSILIMEDRYHGVYRKFRVEPAVEGPLRESSQKGVGPASLGDGSSTEVVSFGKRTSAHFVRVNSARDGLGHGCGEALQDLGDWRKR